MNDNSVYKEGYYREKTARRRAEVIMQDRTRKLYEINDELKSTNEKLLEREKQLVASEKLRALGALSAGVAHEINNPLAYIISNFRSLEKYFQNLLTISETSLIEDEHQKTEYNYIKSDSEDILMEINEGLKRIKDIVENLNKFSRTNSSKRVESDINDAIRTSIKILESEIKQKAEIHLSLHPLPTIYSNENELGQVFLNIIYNAVQAVSEKGLIEIHSRPEDHWALVSIKDNGIGIAKDKITSIFDPFYTSKPVGSGTGLGLSVSHGIISDLGGEILVESEEGKYTEFTIKLPLDQRTRNRNASFT